ncbi:type IV pilus assembly protein PilC [Allopseudospirillum japonicum]|uniref:Type IV pilus assembly protein PilC n=1 Tax=Allopseudospirillum japonicum TaxID=64971 RepID=A0A1H6QQ63_9GAMM|nr:type II secretion system F family protein [Allopseudospirillum japonicum]SEI41142.1 type IV pilus assembly protein PilC [Allopseudospirillum japonicum]
MAASKTAKAPKYHIYLWEGLNSKGEKVKGELQGVHPARVRAELRKQGINAKKIRKKPMDLFGPRKKRITGRDITLFARQMAVMVKAGVPLVQGLAIVADGSDNPSMRSVIMGIRSQVSEGVGFAAALRKYPAQFDDLFCNLVEAGEQSGALETMLERVAVYKEKTESIKGRVKKALYYPVAVIVLGMVVSGVLLVKVVPQFEELFASFNAELPLFTQIVIDLSRSLQAWWHLVLAVIVFIVLGGVYAIRNSPGVAYKVDGLLLKVPVFGELLHKSAVARFARTLATTFAAGVPLVDSLDSAAGSTGNRVYAATVMRVKDDVTTGQQLNFAMRSMQFFPPMLVQMVAIGEEAGSLDTMLTKVADFYEEDVDNLVDGLTSLLEPMVIAFLGVIVGGLVIAMYLPIFEMGSVI